MSGKNRKALKPGEWLLVKRLAGHRCVSCGKPEAVAKLTLDHVLPVSKGGSDRVENVQPLCEECNLRKADRAIDYRSEGWMERLREEQNKA